MSWKATAFVKELEIGLTPGEKLLLFVLADYHNTSRCAAWPSLPTLAKQSLVSTRTAQRILRSLEEKKILTRRGGCGRGAVTEYLFVGLDQSFKQANLTPFISTPEKVTNNTRKGDTTGRAIRKNGIEPVKTNTCDFCSGSGIVTSKLQPGRFRSCVCQS